MVIQAPNFQSNLRLEDVLRAQQGQRGRPGTGSNFMGGIMKNLPGALRKFQDMQDPVVEPQLGPHAGARSIGPRQGMSMDPVQAQGGGGMDLIQSRGFQPMRLEDVILQ